MSVAETVHASCVAIAGKSDLALRLVDRGATLVADDYSLCSARDGVLWATPPARIAGRIEVRGVGIVAMRHRGETPVSLYLDLTAEVPRMPEPASHAIAGIDLPRYALVPFEPSAPIKVELLLAAVAPAS